MVTVKHDSLIEFYQLWPDALAPKPADPSIVGSISLRAFQYCEPFTSASGYGWYMFPPIDFDVRWDGHASVWRSAATRDWEPLRSVVAEEMAAELAAHSTRTGRICPGSFPFLSHAPESGIVQIWSGLVVRTLPDWVVLVRPLANYPREAAFDVLEGIIETDWWVGPLISPIRITKSDLTIEFRKQRPYAQIQLVHRGAYRSKTLTEAKSMMGVQTLTSDLWDAFAKTLLDASKPDRKPGTYKRRTRSRGVD
ncbi:MAG: DUF6065 family protein [Acidobacteriota bacterium]